MANKKGINVQNTIADLNTQTLYSQFSEELYHTVDLNSKLITADLKNDYVKELFRSLRAKVLMGLSDSPDKSIVVTSLEAGAGKSTISANLAIACAQQGMQTLLVDGDMRCGMLHKLFFCPRNPGISEILASDKLSQQPDFVYSIIQQTTVQNLSLLTAGKDVSNPAELLNTIQFKRLKELLAAKYSMIVFDSPPMGVTIDPIVVHEFFSKYLVVVKAGATNVLDLMKKINEYPLIKNKIIGLVLNQASLDKKLAYYKYSKYYIK